MQTEEMRNRLRRLAVETSYVSTTGTKMAGNEYRVELWDTTTGPFTGGATTCEGGSLID